MASRDSNEITVSVVEYADRAHYLMWYRDPISKRRVSRSTEVKRDGTDKARKAAERVAAKWEAELREGRYAAPSKITWDAFRERYELEVLAGQAKGTAERAGGVFNTIERILNPVKLADLTADKLSAYAVAYRRLGRSPNTIKGNLAYVQAALNWAKRMGMLAVVPTIEKQKRAKASKVMKGRPISGEEFDRLLAKVPDVVVRRAKKADADRIVESWRHYLEGLWTSGLRLTESLNLAWDRDDMLCVDFTGEWPMLRIPAALEKGNEDRILPMSPEFAEFLERTPEAERTGFVFNPQSQRVKRRLTPRTVGETICRIGKVAMVKVNVAAKSGKVKFASAHDLRRSFGERWSPRVMPETLRQLMRHEKIETTMRFYLGSNAQTTAAVLWKAHNRAATLPATTAQISIKTANRGVT